MNDKFTNNTDDESIARKLNQIAEQTHASGQFAAELEEKLRNAHQPQKGWSSWFAQISPTLRWVGLMILLAIVLSWSIKSLVPTPQPAVNSTPTVSGIATATPAQLEATSTPIVDSGGYDWRGTKLYLAALLPAAPAQANVSLLKEEQPASKDIALVLAGQFGIQGEVYETPGRLPNTVGYMVTDGKQRLYVQSNLTYDYYADYGAYSYMSGAKNISDDQASAAIDAFMKSHGFDFEYRLENPHVNPGMYYVLPLTSDGLSVRYDYSMPERFEFTVDENGTIVLMSSYQVDYEVIGTYAIRSAEDAFQQVINNSDVIQAGTLETMRSAGISEANFWSRTYPDNETITIYGQPTSYPAIVPGAAPFISIGQFAAAGNLSGIENIDSATYIEATGQFVTENGIRKFQVDSWQVTSASEAYLTGSLRREGDQIILSADDGSGEYMIEDAPADVPLDTAVPDQYLAVHGFMADGKLHWNSIQYYPTGAGGGGGGGGGIGFYRINLSGTLAPFPSPTPVPVTDHSTGDYTVKEGDTLNSIAANFGITVDELMQTNNLTDPIISIDQKLVIPGQPAENSEIGRHLEKQRGTLMISIYNQSDGSSRNEFLFSSKNEDGSLLFARLADVSLADLLPYHNLPIDIWGTVTSIDENGTPLISVEKFEAPYPDLTFQLVQGTQQNIEIDGAPVILFSTEDGKSYVQMTSDDLLSMAIVGDIGDKVYAEVLYIPDETFKGYPAMRVFNMGIAVNPKTGQPVEVTITADQPNIVDASNFPDMENYVPPSLTIETVELVYYTPDPRYSSQNPNPDPYYVQPAWRFYGHYSDGSEVEFLVQALKQEFLLPELAPYTPPG